MPRQHVTCAMSLPRRARAHWKRAPHGLPPFDGTLQGTTLVLVKIASSSVKIDVVSAELQFGTHHGTVLPGPALYLPGSFSGSERPHDRPPNAWVKCPDGCARPRAKNGLSPGAIAGIYVAGVVSLVMVLSCFFSVCDY